jgi:hypothetical protein
LPATLTGSGKPDRSRCGKTWVARIRRTSAHAAGEPAWSRQIAASSPVNARGVACAPSSGRFGRIVGGGVVGGVPEDHAGESELVQRGVDAVGPDPAGDQLGGLVVADRDHEHCQVTERDLDLVLELGEAKAGRPGCRGGDPEALAWVPLPGVQAPFELEQERDLARRGEHHRLVGPVADLGAGVDVAHVEEAVDAGVAEEALELRIKAGVGAGRGTPHGRQVLHETGISNTVNRRL